MQQGRFAPLRTHDDIRTRESKRHSWQLSKGTGTRPGFRSQHTCKLQSQTRYEMQELVMVAYDGLGLKSDLMLAKCHLNPTHQDTSPVVRTPCLSHSTGKAPALGKRSNPVKVGAGCRVRCPLIVRFCLSAAELTRHLFFVPGAARFLNAFPRQLIFSSPSPSSHSSCGGVPLPNPLAAQPSKLSRVTQTSLQSILSASTTSSVPYSIYLCPFLLVFLYSYSATQLPSRRCDRTT